MVTAITAVSFGSSFGSKYRFAKATAEPGRRKYQMLRVSRKPVKKSRRKFQIKFYEKIYLYDRANNSDD